MDAAHAASNETIFSLLSWGASPDKSADNGNTALICAIQSKCVTTIELLAPLTQANLGWALHWLAREKIELMTRELRQLVERAAQDRKAAIIGLKGAAMFGSSHMINMLVQSTMNHSIFEENQQKLWITAVESDNEATVSTLLHLLPTPPLETINLAIDRGVPGVVRLLLPDTKVEGEEEREDLRDAVLTNTAQLLDQIPRDVEFTYNQNMDKLRPLIQENTLVPYTTLLKQLHLPKVHVETKKPKCFFHCNQKESCQRIRETLGLANILTEELGKRNPVFEEMKVTMIGSTREGSRTFFYDEVDVHLSLSEEFKQFTEFDAENQALKRNKWTGWQSRAFDGYFGAKNIFNAEKFFSDFVSTVHSIISTLELPDSFSMLPLTTSFDPCMKCMTLGLKGLQVDFNDGT